MLSPRFLMGAAAGAAAMYFLDPELGRGRRARGWDQARAQLRPSGRQEQSAWSKSGGADVGGDLRLPGQDGPSRIDSLSTTPQQPDMG